MEKLTEGREVANNIKWQQRYCIKMRVGIVAYGLSSQRRFLLGYVTIHLSKMKDISETELNYFGIAICGPKKRVNKLTGSMTLLRQCIKSKTAVMVLLHMRRSAIFLDRPDGLIVEITWKVGKSKVHASGVVGRKAKYFRHTFVFL